ncbi:Mitochondrial matrix cochaperone [Aspergillus nanangensis]|uniref:GrpE protein homolog n=1 Tax=Aspergillus nanangensis TaxID=2582783 RepID=A0AAD4CBU1_ASPNN|nr:Mitochondrial matrix cochaperone [Aspergillus nanangensis]
MFQRTFFRQAQATRSFLSVRSASTASPLTVRRTSQWQPQQLSQLVSRPAFRSYSTENQAEKEGESGEKKEPVAEEDPCQKELDAKKKEVIDLKDKYLRSVADFRNLQERTKREMDNARNFAIQRFAVDLLESIDNFDRALQAVPAEKLNSQAAENKDLVELASGLTMTQNILMNSLKKHGLERFDPSEPTEEGKTQKFDPNRHEATFMAKAEGKDNGDIMYTQSKGFLLNGRVLRAAKVGVVKND